MCVIYFISVPYLFTHFQTLIYHLNVLFASREYFQTQSRENFPMPNLCDSVLSICQINFCKLWCFPHYTAWKVRYSVLYINWHPKTNIQVLPRDFVGVLCSRKKTFSLLYETRKVLAQLSSLGIYLFTQYAQRLLAHFKWLN